jgi:lysophospholipase L1-like esterase
VAGRRAAFVLLAFFAVLGTLEAAACAWERTHPLPDRFIPIPAPSSLETKRIAQAFVDRLGAERDRLGHGTPMIADEERGWALPPSSVVWLGEVPCRIKSLGMRGPELAPKGAGEHRILSLGDSSVFGHGVLEEDVFTPVAARLLSDQGHPTSWAIAAIPGHDSGQALLTLETHGRAVQPDWVLVGTLWSDIYAKPGARPSDAPFQSVRGPLRRLATYRIVRRALAPWLLAREVRWIASREDLGTDAEGSQSRVPLPEYIRNLAQIARVSKDLGAVPVFLSLPAPMDFDVVPPPAVVGRYRAAMALVAEQFDGLYLDGVAALQEQGAGIGWFLDEVHPSTEGHALLAAALANTLSGSIR